MTNLKDDYARIEVCPGGLENEMQTLDFIHPEDAATLKVLQKIPVLPAVMKMYMELAAEQLYLGTSMASYVKLSPTQLPHLYNLLPPICEIPYGRKWTLFSYGKIHQTVNNVE